MDYIRIHWLHTNTGATDDGTRVINIAYRDIILGLLTGEMDLLN